MRELSPEPWRVEVVERIRSVSREERERALERAGDNAATLRGVRIVRQAPVLRHFTAQFELV